MYDTRWNFDTLIEDVFSQARLGARDRSYAVERLDDGLHIEVALPGVSRDAVTVSVAEGALKVELDAAATKGNRFVSNRCRSWRLPNDVDGSAVVATMRDGVLTVVVPYRQRDVHVVEVK